MRVSKLPIFKEQILKLYDSGRNIKDICREINIFFPKGIQRILLENGRVLRGRHTSRTIKNPSRRHSLDLDFFANINSSEKAYWLGYFTADGYVQKNKYRLVLASKDKEIIEKFQKSLKSSHPVSFYSINDKRTGKRYDKWYIQINSKKMITDLSNLGIRNRKSGNCLFPNIDEKFYPDYIRGLFDGDGSVFYLYGKNELGCNLIATEDILIYIQNYLFNKFGIFKSKFLTVKDNIKKWKPAKFSETKIFLDFIYKNSSEHIRMSRKYNIYYKHFYSKISYILWDIDGSLVSSSPQLHHAAMNKALSMIDTKYCISDEDYVKYNGLPTMKKLEMLTSEKGLPKELYNTIWTKKQEITSDLIEKNINKDNDLIKLFNILKNNGYKMGIYTNCIRKTTDMFINKLGIKEYIDVSISNEDVEKPKPDNEGYSKLVEFFNAHPKECVVIEDTKKGEISARTAHCNYLLVDGPQDLYDIDRFVYCLDNKISGRKIKSIIHYKDDILPLEDFIIKYNIPKELFKSRYYNGRWTIEQILDNNKFVIENNSYIDISNNIACDKKHIFRKGLKKCRRFKSFTYQGETKPLDKWAKDQRCLVSLRLLQHRIYGRKWDFIRALTQKPEKKNINGYTYNNKTQSLRKWSEEYNIDYMTLHSRIKNGMDFENSLKTPVLHRHRSNKIYTLDNESKTLAEWSKDHRCKVDYSLLSQRMNYNWDLLIAMTRPSNRKNKKI